MKKLLLLILLFAGLKGYSQCIQNTNSLLFNGTSNYVSFSNDNNLEITDSITVEAWIYPTTFAINVFDGTIFCKHSWTNVNEQGYVLRAGGSGQVSFNLAGVDTLGTILSWQDLQSPVNAIALNTWSHVAGTFDGDSMRLFINGVQVASQAMYGTIVPSTSFPQSIGKISDTGSGQTRYWTGRLDEIRVWHRALSAAELDSNRNHHIDPLLANNLVGYWRFNEGVGTTAADLSPSGNDGFVNGATWIPQVPFSQAAATPIIIPNGNTMTCFPAGSAYQWNLVSGGSLAIPGATQQAYTATLNGSYSVTITDSLGCTATSTTYIITGVTGLLELSKNVTASILNIDGKLTVTFADGTIIKNAILFDVNGKTIQAVDNGKSNIVSFDSNVLANGIYILQLNSAKGNYSSKISLGK